VSVQLLADLRNLFNERNTDKIPSEDICKTLGEMEERPWSEWGRQRKPITTHQLAKILKPFGVTPKTIRIDGDTAEGYTLKGYTLDQLTDPFSRYLPLSNRNNVTSDIKQIVTSHSEPSQEGNVTDRKEGLSSRNIRDVTGVTVRNPLIAEDGGYEEEL